MTDQANDRRGSSPERNWAGNISFRATRSETPAGIGQIQELIKRLEQVKGLGSKHSFNTVADTDGALISPRLLGQEPTLNTERREVTVPAGVRYGEVAEYLWKRGYALPNLASLPHISVVGACATATHGSGVAHGNLATSVRAFEIVTGRGDMRTCSRELDGELFDGMVVNLGALGVITSITLEVVPSFDVAQTVYENLQLATLFAHFDEITSSAYSVSLFTDWGGERINQVWLKELMSDTSPAGKRPQLFGAPAATTDRHPVDGVSAESCTPQCGVPGPWHRRLPHFKLEHTPSVGDELQTEYFVSRKDAPEAIRRLSTLGAQIHPLVLISEIRMIAADSLWLSPNYQRESVGIHFTWKNNLPKVTAILPMIESVLDDLKPTPHWAKLSTMPPEIVRARFPRLADFQGLVRAFDPEGKCHNDFLKRFVL